MNFKQILKSLLSQALNSNSESDDTNNATSSGIKTPLMGTGKSKEGAKKQSKTKQVTQVAKELYNPVDVLTAIKQLGEKAMEAVKFCEEQETKREEIRAQRDREIEIIRAQKEMIMTYLEKTFDERRMIFNKQFEILDNAVSKGDTELLATTLDSINQLATSSPFKSLLELKAGSDALRPGSTIDI